MATNLRVLTLTPETSMEKLIRTVPSARRFTEKREAAYNLEELRPSYYKKYPGVSYAQLACEQNFKCKICREESTEKAPLVFDHCHATGKPRGLLCNSCNLGLGQFKDSVEVLERAIIYLKAAK